MQTIATPMADIKLLYGVQFFTLKTSLYEYVSVNKSVIIRYFLCEVGTNKVDV